MMSRLVAVRTQVGWLPLLLASCFLQVKSVSSVAPNATAEAQAIECCQVRCSEWYNCNSPLLNASFSNSTHPPCSYGALRDNIIGGLATLAEFAGFPNHLGNNSMEQLTQVAWQESNDHQVEIFMECTIQSPNAGHGEEEVWTDQTECCIKAGINSYVELFSACAQALCNGTTLAAINLGGYYTGNLTPGIDNYLAFGEHCTAPVVAREAPYCLILPPTYTSIPK